MTADAETLQKTGGLDPRAHPVEPRADGGLPDLSVIVVTFNSRRHIGACLEALPSALTRHRFEVLVVDNASSDGTPDVVRSTFPDVLLIETGANLGFTRANNRGIAHARGRNVLVLNPDTVADPGSLERLVDLLDADETVGIAAPQLLNLDRSDQGTARAFPTPAAALLGRRSPLTRLWPNNRWSRRYLVGRQQSDREAFPVDWVSGACLMMRHDLARRTNGFDESFFMYWEDADWCRRIKDRGYQVVCEPRAKVVHDEGARAPPLPASGLGIPRERVPLLRQAPPHGAPPSAAPGRPRRPDDPSRSCARGFTNTRFAPY